MKTFVVTIQVKPLCQYFRNVLVVAFYKMKFHQREKIEYIEDGKGACEQPLVSLGEGGKDRERKVTGGGLKRQKIQMRLAEKTVVSRRLKIDLHPSSFFIKLLRCRHSNF